MDIGHYYCDVLDYNTVTRWWYEDENISEFSGYPDSVYDEISNEDSHNKKYIWWKDQIRLYQFYT